MNPLPANRCMQRQQRRPELRCLQHRQHCVQRACHGRHHVLHHRGQNFLLFIVELPAQPVWIVRHVRTRVFVWNLPLPLQPWQHCTALSVMPTACLWQLYRPLIVIPTC